MNSIEYIEKIIENMQSILEHTKTMLKSLKNTINDDLKDEIDDFKKHYEQEKKDAEEQIVYLQQIKTELEEYNEIENLMEEYKIKSIGELENILAIKCYGSIPRGYGKSIVQKGMLYNILSEELGCPLPLIFDAIKKGIVVKPYEDEYGDITLWNSRNETELDTTVSKLEFEEPELLFFDNWVFSCSSGCYRGCVKLKDYQKTWWLKGEKNE